MTLLLLDMNVDRRVGALLVARGHDVVHVGDIGMARSSDKEIMQFALDQRRVVVTHDSDFASLLARSGDKAPSVIRVRAPLTSHAALAQLLADALEAAAPDLDEGAVVSVSERGARIHRLPIGAVTK